LAQLRPTRSFASIDEIWFELEEYWDFLNYTLLEHLVDTFGYPAMKTRMLEYKEALVKFRHRTRLCEFAKHYKCFVGKKVRMSLKVKFSENWEECTLEDLENWKESITQQFFLPSFVASLQEMDSGCVSITWAIPTIFASPVMEIVKMTTTQDFCKAYGIKSLKIDDEEYLHSQTSDAAADSTTSKHLCMQYMHVQACFPLTPGRRLMSRTV
jgi:hypothetical protein